MVQRIHDNGHVYAGTYEGWYCPRCADFKTESELEDGNRCPIHKIVLEIEKEDNWFFRLSAFQEPLEQLYAERPGFVTPQNRYNEALSFIKSGLRDLSLSRARLKWGVPVPWDESQVIYVWIDALLNYYTALSYARPGEDLTERFWPANVHLIGKDILKFHAVIWPALLMAAGIEVPQKVAIHGYLLLGEHKMSKSLGNVIEPFQVAEVYGPDALRFYVLREVSFGSDGEVSPEGFETSYNTELANEYGNLASRTLAMIDRYRDGVVPAAEPPAELEEDFEGLLEAVKARIDEVELTAALDEIWRASSASTATSRTSSRGSWRRTPRRPSGSTRCSTRSPRGCAWCRCCCMPSCPSSPSGCSRRSAARTSRWTARGSAPCPAGRRSASSASSSPGSRPRRRPPEGPAVIDTHCHLDSCEPPVAELVGRARAAGVTRMATVGMNGPSIEHALTRRGRPRRGDRDRGTPPARERRLRRAALEEIERAAAHPRARAIGETGLDYYRDHAPRDDQRRAFEAQLELAARTQLPVVIHTRAAEDDTFALLREHAASLPAVILHCFSAPDRLDECVERGYLCSFAGNVTYPKATELQQAARELPAELLLVETDSPYLSPQPLRGKPNEPANVAHTARFVAELRGSRVRGARADRRGERRARVRVVSGGEPRQASLRRLRAFGIRPNRELGQNFLIDDNILRVIGAAAELDPATWCSRSAAGSACCPSTWRRGWRTCTWSRWTARSSRRCARRSSRSTTRRSTWATP